MLKDKIVFLGVTGGIAAYKSAELARLLIKSGAVVQAVMTPNAEKFITPLTLRTITGRPVYLSMFEERYESATVHIDLAREPDLVVVAPATANILGKLASGIADDLLSTALLAVDIKECPVFLAPSMNTVMFNNPAVRDNIRTLRQRGYLIAEPGEGFLACGEVGKGRMLEPAQLLELIERQLSTDADFQGLTVIVSAGPTREPFDPVRFLSNYSTGRMGYALAAAAKERGARVLLVSGPTALAPPPGVEFFPVGSAREMYAAIMEKLPLADIVIKAAAVADYRPKEVREQKIKKGAASEELVLTLERNPDILKEIGLQKGKRLLVGFAAETENLLENAARKLREKNVDIIVANDLSQEGAGFATETNQVHLLYRDGSSERLPLMTKDALSHSILDSIKGLRLYEKHLKD
jgi:phosphopantothenoylcysteine decarboxylase/phosphopantothenate--cysteine ligase